MHEARIRSFEHLHAQRADRQATPRIGRGRQRLAHGTGEYHSRIAFGDRLHEVRAARDPTRNALVREWRRI